MKATTSTPVTPEKIMQTGTAFFASKTLMAAVNMGLFTHLGNGAMSGPEIQKSLGLSDRSLYDFLDALVALGFLHRTGIKDSAMYTNAEESDLFLDKGKPSYIGGILEMANNRLYPFWNNLEKGLKTGLPQNEIKDGDKDLFEHIYADSDVLREFILAMSGVQMGNFITFAKTFNFTGYHTLCDIGGANGQLSAQVSLHHPHMHCTTFDLPEVSLLAEENLAAMNLHNRVKVVSGDFFKDDFPEADVITMGNILHDWGEKDKKVLIRKAFDAIPEGGAFVIIENIIDDDRRENAAGLLMSLNMLIETAEGYDFSAKDFKELSTGIGFNRIETMPLTGPASALIAFK